MNIEALIEYLRAWGQGECNVLAIGLCGSYAQGMAIPEYDIDLVIISRSPALLLA